MHFHCVVFPRYFPHSFAFVSHAHRPHPCRNHIIKRNKPQLRSICSLPCYVNTECHVSAICTVRRSFYFSQWTISKYLRWYVGGFYLKITGRHFLRRQKRSSCVCCKSLSTLLCQCYGLMCKRASLKKKNGRCVPWNSSWGNSLTATTHWCVSLHHVFFCPSQSVIIISTMSVSCSLNTLLHKSVKPTRAVMAAALSRLCR